MTFHPQGHASIAFAANNLEFIFPHRQPTSPLSLPSKENLERLKASLSKAYPVTEPLCFDELLGAIDKADQKTAKRPANS